MSPGQDLAARLGAVYTGALTDALDALGHLHQTLPPEIVPLAAGMRMAGPAYTIEGEPADDVDPARSIRLILDAFGAVPPGHVAIYQSHDHRSAQLGELSVTSLKARGCVGAVIDGGCRDVDLILREGFPVFSRYRTPQDGVPRWRVTGHGHPIEIGAVRVAPGDHVVADADGVVVVPAAVADEVCGRAEAVVGRESLVRDAVRDGMLPLEAFERFGKF